MHHGINSTLDFIRTPDPTDFVVLRLLGIPCYPKTRSETLFNICRQRLHAPCHLIVCAGYIAVRAVNTDQLEI